ncbi:pif-4 [Alphabaculovirus alterspexiguae]|uniref:Pif-4 n=1 Tax=Spodoptera exigua multiple nucleopolyhedrovirus TaxID=10454 RepID=A0A3G2JTS9_9ABAC|nr:pif-4 [Spodoptera exigua multiple nucleopolyhedrovirus]AYN45021.1 pif-4 [Spodoptera exigua multiple nucleopolyhedrovirus]
MTSVLISTVAILCLFVYLIALLYLNPYRTRVEKLINDHQSTLQFGAYIDVYDLSAPPDRVERLFIIRPENVLLYNLNGTLFYYLESSSVFCPQEFSLVRFTKSDIQTINDSGVYNTVCTNVNSLVVLEHFLTVKNNLTDLRIILSVDQINYTILDIINYLILLGYVQIK